MDCFRYILRLRCYKQKSVEVGAFWRGWVTLNVNLRPKGALPTNHCWCKKTRVIALSHGIKISAVHCLILSQTRVWQTGRRTDGRTDRHTELRQLILRQHSCLLGKNRSTFSVCCLKHIAAGGWSGAGAERAKNLVSRSEKNWLEVKCATPAFVGVPITEPAQSTMPLISLELSDTESWNYTHI